MVDDKKRLESLFYFKNKLMLNHGITASGFLSYLATLFEKPYFNCCIFDA